MTRNRRKARFSWLAWPVLAGLFVVAIYLLRPSIQAKLFDLTGEEALFSQLKGLTDLAADAARPRLHLASDAPVRYANLNPFGINVFLNEEVEPAKREQTVRLAAEAGFHWLRQEFPWQDIEIHGKGDFEDRRNTPARPAWEKYDQIVDLAGKYGMELVVRVSTPPSWTRARGDAAGTFAPPDNYEDFGDFVYALVSRYKGRIKFYQLWNEPNIYPEWGNYSISPEDYTRLLQIGATRAREADPNAVIIAGALASTIALQPDAPPPGNALNDLVFLQRMYDAGAAPYFDIMAMQAYGLWSGPTDRRSQPRVMNFGRPQFVRDVMVANGDTQKPIWISEMAWNSVPADAPDQRFGRVTPDQQARYTALAYQRALEEWPWAGVVNTWYFKRANDDWLQQQRPEAYFRLADPDFTLQPVYNGLKSYLTAVEPALYPGTREPLGWATKSEGSWQAVDAEDAPFGTVYEGQAGAALRFVFYGTGLAVTPGCAPAQGAAAPASDCSGTLTVSVDGSPAKSVAGAVRPVRVARGLEYGRHEAELTVSGGNFALAALNVGNDRLAWLPWTVAALALALVLVWLSLAWRRVVRASRPVRKTRTPVSQSARRAGSGPQERPAYLGKQGAR